MREPLLTQQELLAEEPLLLLEAKHEQIQRQMEQAEVAQAEDTPAYATLQTYGLLDTSYRKEHFQDIFMDTDLTANSSKEHTLVKRFKWGVYFTPGCGWIVYVSLTLCSCGLLVDCILFCLQH